LRDLQAAQAVGVSSILVRTGKGMKTAAQLEKEPTLAATPVFDNLKQAVDALLANR